MALFRMQDFEHRPKEFAVPPELKDKTLLKGRAETREADSRLLRGPFASLNQLLHRLHYHEQ